MKKLREYAIGRLLSETDDVFEKARIILMFQFGIVFAGIFFLPLLSDILLGFKKALIIHIIDSLTLFAFPYMLRKTKNIDNLINFFFTLCWVSSILTYLMLNPESMEPVGTAWFVFFVLTSALIQKGKARILFACILFWLPLAYVFINGQLHGALTIQALKENVLTDPPLPVIFIPTFLGIYTMWFHTRTIRKAKETIMLQKALIEEKNKDITDSIVYARRMQDSFLPTEKYISQNLKRLKK
jgi:hypothetical protein